MEDVKVGGEPQGSEAPVVNNDDFQLPDKFKAETEKESLQKAVTSYQELEKELENPEIYESESKFNATMDRYNLLLTDNSFVLEESKFIELLDKLGMNKNILTQKLTNSMELASIFLNGDLISEDQILNPYLD